MEVKEAIAKTTLLYAGLGWKSLFTKLRFYYAPFTDVEKLLPRKGVIIDLGCGEGIFANFVGLRFSTRQVLGIEIDKNRILLADKGLKNVSFKIGNIVNAKLPKADAIVLIQVLHHLNTYKEQENILRKAVQSLRKGGKLIIVEIKIALSLQYFLTWIADHFLVAWFFEKRLYAPIHFRKVGDWEKTLRNKDLSCATVFSEKQIKLFSNVIFSCTKN